MCALHVDVYAHCVKCMHIVHVHTCRLSALAWSPDGRLLAAASPDMPGVTIWDVASGESHMVRACASACMCVHDMHPQTCPGHDLKCGQCRLTCLTHALKRCALQHMTHGLTFGAQQGDAQGEPPRHCNARLGLSLALQCKAQVVLSTVMQGSQALQCKAQVVLSTAMQGSGCPKHCNSRLGLS